MTWYIPLLISVLLHTLSLHSRATQSMAEHGSVISKLGLLLTWPEFIAEWWWWRRGYLVYTHNTDTLALNGGVAVDVLWQYRGETVWKHPHTYLLLSWGQVIPFLWDGCIILVVMMANFRWLLLHHCLHPLLSIFMHKAASCLMPKITIINHHGIWYSFFTCPASNVR
jgi:hypothetical protein